MRNHIPQQLKEMLAADAHCAKLVKEGRFAEAEPILRAVRDDARKAGWGHASMSHHMSYICFRQGRLEEALELTLDALAQDPLNRDYNGGYQAVLQRMRETIEAADLPAGDARIPRYHALLAREAETTVETHLALLRHLAAVGNHEEAARISEALSVLHPEHPEVWRYRGAIDAEVVSPAGESVRALSLLPVVVAKA